MCQEAQKNKRKIIENKKSSEFYCFFAYQISAAFMAVLCKNAKH